ncbi:MAG: hypothetical protein Q9M13_09035 [Mariprofundales bacterium]|nr:hypothetical protein [Mariprofundales bacterium]
MSRSDSIFAVSARGAVLCAVVVAVMLLLLPRAALATPASDDASLLSAERIMQHYTEQQDEISAERKITLRSKHEVLFWMGAALLLGLLSTAFFGVGMGIFGRDWFVPHMVSAGLTVSLGIAHAVTAFVWFWPY